MEVPANSHRIASTMMIDDREQRVASIEKIVKAAKRRRITKIISKIISSNHQGGIRMGPARLTTDNNGEAMTLVIITVPTIIRIIIGMITPCLQSLATIEASGRRKGSITTRLGEATGTYHHNSTGIILGIKMIDCRKVIRQVVQRARRMIRLPMKIERFLARLISQVWEVKEGRAMTNLKSRRNRQSNQALVVISRVAMQLHY